MATMINLASDILQALEDDTALVELLGGKRIYRMTAPDAEEFPRITFFELDNTDVLHADDEAKGSLIYFQVDVWNKGATSAIAAEVDRVMKSLDFMRYSAPDLYEPDTGVHHKAMRYRIGKTM